MGVEEGEEIQTKGVDNFFTRIKQRTSLTSRKSHPGAGSL
jgi:hypothetical protein